LKEYLRGKATGAEPEDEEPSYAVAQEAMPLEAHDAASLFQVMARPARSTPRPTLRRRRRRFRLPEWVLPLLFGAAALGTAGVMLHYFVQLLERRHPPAAVDAAAEQARVQERQRLDAFLVAWRSKPGPRPELDAWLDSAVGRRMDLPSDVNHGLARYQILERDQWAEGVRRLLLAGDTPWRKAAEAEVAALASAEAAAELACADAWWAVAESLTGPGRAKVRGRAVEWYRKVAPKLDGSDAARAKERS
jgi:hypothetical protein